MSKKKKTVLRVMSDDWLNPIDFKSEFPTPGNSLEVDIGSGKGRFLMARSGKHLDTNFLGIERQLGRIHSSGRRCERAGRDNCRVFRMEGYYAISYLMPSNYVANYYFFFPDPWPKDRHHENRLFNPAFMDALFKTLIDGGCLHVSSDHLPYFEEIYALLQKDERFEEIEAFTPDAEETTDFELIFSYKKIGRCSFKKRSVGVVE